MQDLAKELVGLQTKLTDAFFNEVIKAFQLAGSDFNRNAIAFFDNANECNAEINKVDAALKALKLDTDAAAAVKCNVNCANNIKLAAECVQDAVRAAYHGQRAVVAGLVTETQNSLDRAQLPVFDKVFNNVQQAAFLDISDDDARLKQIIDAFVTGQIAAAVAESQKGNYADYKEKVVAKADVQKEVAEILVQFNLELAKDARLVDLAKRINALQAQPEGLLIKQAFDLAAARKAKVAQPVVIHARVSNLADAAAVDAAVTEFKKTLGPETVFAAAVADAKNAGKKQFDLVTGVDQNEINTQDSEFGISCVRIGATCEIIQDIHRDTFLLLQKEKPKGNVPAGDDGYNAPAPVHHQPAAADADSASSLVMAAGAVLAALAMFL